MAAYLDLNPVRAGIVEDPKDYRFCGYAEAVAGGKRAEAGLALVWAGHADGAARSQFNDYPRIAKTGLWIVPLEARSEEGSRAS